MSKLWQKTTNVNQLVEDFTVGRDTEFDVQMAAFDVLGSLAHTQMLESIGLMSAEDLQLVQKELKSIYAEILQRVSLLLKRVLKMYTRR
jgi:argininosuccinate lyase